jgi:hypothetical protein
LDRSGNLYMNKSLPRFFAKTPIQTGNHANKTQAAPGLQLTSGADRADHPQPHPLNLDFSNVKEIKGQNLRILFSSTGRFPARADDQPL